MTVESDKTIIVINGEICDTPQKRILLLEEAARVICEKAKVGPDDGAMALMTACIHVTMRHSGKSANDLQETLAYCLGCATTVADDFFPAGKKVIN